MTLNVQVSGVDTSEFTWRYATPPVQAAIYTYHQIKGANKGKVYPQGRDSATTTVSVKCPKNKKNTAVFKSLAGRSCTITSDAFDTMTGYITGVSPGENNSVWLFFNMTVTED